MLLLSVDDGDWAELAELEAAWLGTFCPDGLLSVGAKKADAALPMRVASPCSIC